MRRILVVAAVAAAALVPAVTNEVEAEAPPPGALLLGAEDNRLIAYDPATGESVVALGSAAEGGLDLNAQICADPANPGYFIAGEDTDQDSGLPEDAPGWGYLKLAGTSLADLTVTMEGNLVPTYSNVTDNPENYGCGFLSDGRLLTSDVGDQLPFAEANGQLILWFPDPVLGFASNAVAYCKIDLAIPTAGGIHVDAADRVYVAANRPGLPTNLDLGGIYRYQGAWPTGPTAAEGCGRLDATGAPLVSEGVIFKSRFITGEPIGALTPSAIVARPEGGFYVSSVLSGVIAQYTEAGTFVRRVLEPPVLSLPPYPTGTPFGLAVGADGSLYYADIGVEIGVDVPPSIGPGDHNGNVRRIRFVDGEPRFPETLRTGLQYPDGLGFVLPVGAPPEPPAPSSPSSSSEWPCGSWGMYGGNVGRTFSTECPTSINPLTVVAMIPAWVVRMPRTVTASPAVVEGTVYVGDWSGTMYALRASDGGQRWSFRVTDAPGAAFGPIVSSAAVTDVDTGDGARRLVIFGAGPRLYALDAADGSLVWQLDRSAGIPDTPTEIESSPVVFEGVVYVGIDTHNNGIDDTGGIRGGLLAVDAGTGALLWTFEPELGQPGVGCGSVWSSPTIDTVERTVLIGTGNCSAEPSEFTWNTHTEAITAIDLDTQAVAWTFQPHPPNRADLDFGATPNIITLAGGRRLVGVGNKDAVYYAIDPATGALVWRSQLAIPGNIGEDFAVGGFIGSTATWRGDVFGTTALGGPPWYQSVDGATGARQWSGIAGPSYAASAVINDVVFSGDLTGLLHIQHASSGLPLGAFPLLGPISSGPAIAGDLVVIGSGTSSSDLCAKGSPGSEACFALFDQTLGSIGAVTAFRPLRLLGSILPLPTLRL